MNLEEINAQLEKLRIDWKELPTKRPIIERQAIMLNRVKTNMEGKKKK